MIYKLFCNTEINFMNLEKMEQTILSFANRNLVFVMNESSVVRWRMDSFIKKIQRKVEIAGSSFIWINDVASNPTQADIVKVLKQIGSQKIDLIIAVGGGSVIDLAKGISAFKSNNNKDNYSIHAITENIIGKEYINNEFIDIIAVPTTAGTGSELTQWATIWDRDKNIKFSIDTQGLKPKRAIIVPELTLTLSPLMTLSTGLDAMCQAIESYWSRHTTPLVQDIAYRAVELIVKNLNKSLENPNHLESREKLCRASVLAGLAFSQTRTTACHSISYPLTMLYDIPHGLAVAMTLGEVAKKNASYYPNDSDLMSLFTDSGGIKEWLNYVSQGIVELRLSYFDIGKDDISVIVENAFTGGRMDNNPVILTEEDVREILELIF